MLSAFEWASARSLVRINPMHGEQEAKLILDDTFSFKEENGVARTQQIRMDVEESWFKTTLCIHQNVYIPRYACCVFFILKAKRQIKMPFLGFLARGVFFSPHYRNT